MRGAGTSLACVCVVAAVALTASASTDLPSRWTSDARAAPTSKAAPGHKRKKPRFTPHGVSYTPYVPPRTEATQGSHGSTPEIDDNQGGPPPSMPISRCRGALRTERWPPTRRLTVWGAFAMRGRFATDDLSDIACTRVHAFVRRLALTPGTDGTHILPRGWTCDLASPKSTCTHVAATGAADLQVEIGSPGAIAVFGSPEKTVAVGGDTPSSAPTEVIETSAAGFPGIRHLIVVGSRTCGPSAAATEASMSDAGRLLYADDHIVPTLRIRPTRRGIHDVCLFWQFGRDDRHALAVVRATFYWSPTT